MITTKPTPPAPEMAPPVIGHDLPPDGLDASRGVALVVALGLFLFACVVPAGYGEGGFLEGGVAPPGFVLLLFGWAAVLFSPWYLLAWLANPLFGVSAFFLWHRYHL